MQKRVWKLLALLLCAAMILGLTLAAAQAEGNETVEPEKTEDRPAVLTETTEKTEKSAETRGATRGTVYSDEPLAVGENSFVIANGGDVLYRPFTPEEDGVYVIFSTGDEDTYGYLEKEGSYYYENDDGGEGYNFYFRKLLSAGETCYVGAEYYSSSETGTISVTIKQYPVNACGENLFWSLNASAGKLTITGTGEMWNYEESNPAPWYTQREHIQSVALPAGLTAIGDYAFFECDHNFASVTIPNGVKYVGSYAFYQCSYFQSVTVPDGVTTIAHQAFANCYDLESVSLPATLQTIGTGIFADCPNLLGENVAIDPANPYWIIEDGVFFSKDKTMLCAFFDADPRTRYTVPDSVKSILGRAFLDCRKLQRITVPNTVQDIGKWAFYGCENLGTMRLPDGLDRIRERTFSECNNLYWIVMPDSVEVIEGYAFSGCSDLQIVYYTGEQGQREEIWFGDGNEELEEAEWHYVMPATRTATFDSLGGSPVAPVTFRTGDVVPKPEDPTKDGFVCVGWVLENASTQEVYSFEYPELYDVSFQAKWVSNQCGDNLYWSFDRAAGKLTITGTGNMYDYVDWRESQENCSPWWDIRNEIKTVALPAGITSIGDYAFQDCNGFATVVIPNTLKWIGKDAFFSCDGMTSITIPDSVMSIMEEAFIHCEKLKTVKLGKNVEYIGAHAFYECESFENVTIPAKTDEIDGGAFAACPKLSRAGFKVDPNNETFTVSDGVLIQCGDTLHTYLCGEPRTSYTVPDGIVNINTRAFEACGNLVSITFPESVTWVGSYAFANCCDLVSVTLSDQIEYLGVCAFKYCSRLKSIRIPSSLDKIAAETFCFCDSLEWIVLPKSVTNVGDSAFCDCDSLTDVYYTGTEQDRQNINISTVGDGPASDNLPLLRATWHYVKASYVVTFDPNNGEKLIRRPVGVMDTAKKPLDPTKPGYKFLGWYHSDKLYDFNTPILSNITLTAKWEVIQALKGTVEFNKSDVQFNGKTPYVVYNGKAQTPRVIVKDKDGKTVSPSKYVVTYRNNTAPGTAYVDVTMKDKSGYASLWFKIYLPPTTTTTVANTQSGIQISWKAVPGAKGYVIYRRAWNLKSAGWTTFERWNNTTRTTWTDTKVYAGTRYQYGVKAYFNDPMDNYNLGLVGPLKTTVRITTRVLNEVKPGSRKLLVKWTGSALFTGYQVQIATDAKFTKDVKTVTIDKAKTYQTTVTGLKARTVYYVRVRSYHIFEGTTYYGGWSNVLPGKTK